MSTKIKRLKTNGVSGLIVHEVGKLGVTEIRDNLMDSEQSIISQYLIYIDGKLKHSYENGVYEIDFD